MENVKAHMHVHIDISVGSLIMLEPADVFERDCVYEPR